MVKTIAVASVVLFTAVLVLGTTHGVAIAQKPVPNAQDKLALGQAEAERLLLLITPDKKGNVSRDEWIKFMAAEFDRLDKNHTGEIDAKKLAQSLDQGQRVHHFSK